MSIEAAVSHIYRVGKFIVPASAREEFLANAHRAREVLTMQKGFIQDLYLEQISETGDFNIVTIAQWESQTDAEQAGAALAAYLKSINFNPQEANRRLGIHSEASFYQKVAGWN